MHDPTLTARVDEARGALLAARAQHRRGTHAYRNLTDALDHLDNGRLRAAARYAAHAIYVGAEPGRITDALLVIGAEIRVDALYRLDRGEQLA